MRRIFVPLQGPGDALALLSVAGVLAARTGAQVEAALVTDAAGPEAADTHAIFTRWAGTLTSPRIEAGWREIPDGAVYAGASLGRASDLTVTRASADRRFRDALLASGRPTLLIPSGREPARAMLDHVVLAWDGSAGAARALGQSMALLARARTVRIVIIGRNTLGAQAREAIASSVLLHNEQTRLVVHESAHRQTGRVLLDALRDEAASLVVMGVRGRSHSAAAHPAGSAETMGGTILKVIEDGQIPILTAV